MSMDEPKREGEDAPEADEAPKLAGDSQVPAARRPAKKPQAAKPAEGWVDALQTIGIALAIVLVFRSFLFQPFNIPSESMKPTLLVGDFLFVSKFSYGYSRNSFPFSLPLVPGPNRLFFHAPKRGDVAVFKTPVDNRTDLIKRVIGLPGDEIQMKSGVLFINGRPVQRRAIGPYTSTDPRTGLQTTGTLYRETLPNGVSYTTLDLEETPQDDTAIYKVPPRHYFMMGDNRDNSTDSRFPTIVGGVGYVPAVNFVGKAEIFFFSVAPPKPAWAIWQLPFHIRFNRILHRID